MDVVFKFSSAQVYRLNRPDGDAYTRISGLNQADIFSVSTDREFVLPKGKDIVIGADQFSRNSTLAKDAIEFRGSCPDTIQLDPDIGFVANFEFGFQAATVLKYFTPKSRVCLLVDCYFDSSTSFSKAVGDYTIDVSSVLKNAFQLYSFIASVSPYQRRLTYVIFGILQVAGIGPTINLKIHVWHQTAPFGEFDSLSVSLEAKMLSHTVVENMTEGLPTIEWEVI